ncbi:MAG: lanthionine synthetase C family protein, partial [Trebonia sp.]
TALADLLAAARDPRRWHTPARLSSESLLEAYPGGHHNCGLAHGVPGPLALLSIAMIEAVPEELGGLVDGPRIRAAIAVTAHWLADHRTADAWGPTWPNAVPLADAGDRAAPAGGYQGSGSSRATWCYGSPGVARALWLAGSATEDDELRALALTAMRAALARPAEVRGITSPTLCHGTAGLLQIAHRFAEDTGLPDLAEARDALLGELVAAYDPEAILGYRNVEPSGARVDQPGLLEGAAGVALTLLSAGGASSAWDRALLLA